jgi:predicted ATP-dependent endonuclease of OLD family
MDIEPPEIDYSHSPPMLHMFCPEERIPREIFWAGFGFQVWCQMLTFIVKSRYASLFVIDEPDIYLHSDLQRQLIGLLKNLGPDILIATHSTEIISEADPDELLVINKKFQSAKRITDPSQLQNVFGVLGSNLNPTLTQIAKSKRVVFVEGKDFQILSGFARKLGKNQVANRSDFAVVPTEGFNAHKVLDFSHGIELTLGTKIAKAIIFDRDYRSNDAVRDTLNELRKVADYVQIHGRKEIENYLLVPVALKKAIDRRLEDRRKRTTDIIKFEEDLPSLLQDLSAPLKSKIAGQYLAKRSEYEHLKFPHLDQATINAKVMEEFDQLWQNLEARMMLVPGKEMLSILNQYIQKKYQISLSLGLIIASFKREEVPKDIVEVIEKLDEFRQK